MGTYIDVINEKIIEDALILIEGERITYAGERHSAPFYQLENYEMIVAKTDEMILPGFIDCHIHISGDDDDQYLAEIKERLLLKAAGDMKDMLNSGFTGARDMTQFAAHLKWAVDKGYLEGPRIKPGGQVLSVTAGHGDMNTNFPYDYARDNILTYLMDGTTECLKGVRKQFREGAEFIKICATGGVSSMQDGLEDVQFSDEEMTVIVEEAQRHGAYVAAHCSGLAGAKQALKAGVKSIEHGIHLDQECVDIMKANHCSLVTTLSISLHLHEIPDLPEFMAKKAKHCAVENLKSIKLVREAGVNVALGTDYSNGSNSYSNYRYLGREFGAICEAGFTEMQSLQCGTINGAKLMEMENDIGSITAGKYADIVMVKGNPLEDINVLGDGHNISFVMKSGKIIKEA